MRAFHLLFTFLVIPLFFQMSKAQSVSSRILTREETEKIFTDSVKNKFNIDFPVYRVYSYIDKSGKNYLVLTEKKYKEQNGDVLNDSIKAFSIKEENKELKLNWMIRDFKNKQENSIWFWTKYCTLEDSDGDGWVEPVIIYGTSGENGTDDGRLKILVFYKGEKRAIRHQSGTLDFERNTQVDKSFYELPEKVQLKVKAVMKQVETNNNIIFPAGYEEKMSEKKLYFDEQ